MATEAVPEDGPLQSSGAPLPGHGSSQLPDAEKAIDEYLAILDEHRQECVANGMYEEARVAQNRLALLREQEKKRRAEAVRTRHIAERLDVEEAHMREFEQFNGNWNRKMREYDERTCLLEEAMEEKHSHELHAWQENMQNQFLLRPKFSRDLLNLRDIEDKLAKQKKYAEAQKVKLKADMMEKWELENLKKGWRRKFLQKQANFVAKQQQEQEAFKKRIEAGRKKQQRVRHEKLCCVLQRYNNIKMGLSRQQNLEAINENRLSGNRPFSKSKASKRAQTARSFASETTSSIYLNPRVDYQRPTTSSDKSKTMLEAIHRPDYTNMLSVEKTRRKNHEGFEKREQQRKANGITGKVSREPNARTRLRKKAAKNRGKPTAF